MFKVESQSNSLHQIADNNFLTFRVTIQARAAHSVALWRITTVGPVDHLLVQIELEINRLGKSTEEHFNIGAICRILAFRNFKIRPEDGAFAGVVTTFLCPI